MKIIFTITVLSIFLIDANGQQTSSGYIFFNSNRGFTASRNWAIQTNVSHEGDFQIGTGDTNTSGIPDFYNNPSLAKLTINNLGRVGIGTTTPDNKLQIGPNPQGWVGNDLVISNTLNGNPNSTQVLISNAADHSMIYGSADIAIRPGFGKWSIYSKGSNAYVGIGHNAPTSMLHVLQGSNTDWATTIQNNGGSGKGLLVKSGSGPGETAPILQLEDNLGNNRFMVRSDGLVGVGTSAPKQNLHVKGRFYLEGTEAYPSGWLQNYFHWRGHSLIMGSEIGVYAHNTIELKAGGTNSGALETYFQMFTTPSPNNYTLKLQLSSTGDSFFNGGNVGIGTASPDAKLAVKGTIHTQEVKVDMTGWSDFVFEPGYKLQSLESIADYIKSNKHLPDVPSSKEVEENGVNLGEMNKILLQKIEELTLYLLDQEKRILELEKTNNIK